MSIYRGIEILKLDTDIIKKVAKDQRATTPGILILLISGLIAGLITKKVIFLLVFPIITPIFSFIGIGLLHLIARLFKGKAKFIQFYRALTHASILSWLSIFNLIPFLKIIIPFFTFIWGIIVIFVIIKNLYKLSTPKTVFVMLIPAAFFIILIIFGTIMYTIINPEAAGFV